MRHALLAACVLLSVLSLAGCSNCAADEYSARGISKIEIRYLTCQPSLNGNYFPYNNEVYAGKQVLKFQGGNMFIYFDTALQYYFLSATVGSQSTNVVLKWNGQFAANSIMLSAQAWEWCGRRWDVRLYVMSAWISHMCFPCPQYSTSPEYSTGITACQCKYGYTGNNGDPCTLCKAGTFKAVLGSVACTDCTAGTYSAAGSTTDTSCKCNAGYTGANGGACSQCIINQYEEGLGPGN